MEHAGAGGRTERPAQAARLAAAQARGPGDAAASTACVAVPANHRERGQLVRERRRRFLLVVAFAGAAAAAQRTQARDPRESAAKRREPGAIKKAKVKFPTQILFFVEIIIN